MVSELLRALGWARSFHIWWSRDSRFLDSSSTSSSTWTHSPRIFATRCGSSYGRRRLRSNEIQARTIGIGLTAGRDFNATDVPGSAGVIIVSEDFAQRAWPGTSAVGKPVSVTGAKGPFLTVIGVAQSALTFGLGERVRPIVYRSQLQTPSARDVALLGVIGALAVTLASIGLYAVVSFSVGQRTREIGIRIARGAARKNVVRMFVAHGIRVTIIGVVVGGILSVAAVRVLSAIFVGLAAPEAVSFVIVAGLLAGAAVLASWIPARRAARVDPMVALRAE
ncbi:MAG: FtsX-like permease family protein [bacterium]